MIDDLAPRGYVAISAGATELAHILALYIRTGGTMDFMDAGGNSHTAVEVVAGTYFVGPIRRVTALGSGATVLGVKGGTRETA